MTIPYGFCQCGCGQQTTISNRNWKRFGYVTGQPFKFMPGHSGRITRRPDIYITRRVAGRKHGTAHEHVLIAERALGKPLPPRAQVHHVDGDRRNNTPSNLVICQSQSYHSLLHVRMKTIRAGGDPNTDQVCGACGMVKPLAAFSLNARNQATGRTSQCRACAAIAWNSWSERKKAAKVTA